VELILMKMGRLVMQKQKDKPESLTILRLDKIFR
jgi:hypothetical protein